MIITICIALKFLSTLSLRRATINGLRHRWASFYFYPRSPCGERPMMQSMGAILILFLSTLSLRRATIVLHIVSGAGKFLSTLSLRRATHYDNYNLHCVEISIHALLAESDCRAKTIATKISDFYPRSPCGERQDTESTPDRPEEFLSTLSLRRATHPNMSDHPHNTISIHALLAESDINPAN